MSSSDHFSPLSHGKISVSNSSSYSDNFRNRFHSVPIGMTILGFILYSYGYWRAKFGTDDSWLIPLIFVGGLALYVVGLALV
jgi:hypothetical protein